MVIRLEALLAEVFLTAEALILLRCLVLRVAHSLHYESSIKAVVFIHFIRIMLAGYEVLTFVNINLLLLSLQIKVDSLIKLINLMLL